MITWQQFIGRILRRPIQKPDEWDFTHLTLAQAKEYLFRVAQAAGTGEWITLNDENRKRFIAYPGGGYYVESISNHTPWPLRPGQVVRVNVVKVLVGVSPLHDWVADVPVGNEGELPPVFDGDGNAPHLLGMSGELRPENLARWAKRIELALAARAE